MKPLLARYRRVLGQLVPRVAVWSLALPAVALLLTGRAVPGSLLAIAAVGAGTWFRLAQPGADRHLVARAALAVGVVAATPASGSPLAWVEPVCLLALLGALMVEPTVDHAARPALSTSGLPELRLPLVAMVREPLLLGNSAGVVALAAGALGAGEVLPGVISAALAGLGLAVAGVQLRRARRRATEQDIGSALAAHAPRWALYYNGTAHGLYQVTMWLPHLARTGERGLLVIRDPRCFTAAGRLGLPVVLARSLESLEYVAHAGPRAFFYVNNDPKNAHGVRFGHLTHVQLGHGDSDKPASYHAGFAMFDRIFVAGQAAVDRFARHGVAVPAEKFVLVGRPQVEAIEVRTSPDPSPQPVVLYAPTWRGGLQDSRFSSLPWGERIVGALLAAGATVWFRPHPYSAGDAGSREWIRRIDALLPTDAARRHRRSTDTAPLTVFGCLNASDALVTDISSVASDYLYSDKPLALTDTGRAAGLVGYPLAGAAVRLPVTGDLAGPLAELLGPDSRRVERAGLRRYYLGDWPAAGYPEVFVAAARAAMGLKG